jgi:PrtD family type I secretion system ABC transporter
MLEITDKKNTLKSAIMQCKKVFIITFCFSFVVNLFMSVQAVYSLQVLNRVLTSNSIETLFWLTVAITVLYATSTLIQIARSFTLIKVGEWLDKKLAPILFSQSVEMASLRQSVGASQNLRDLEVVKSFLSSVGINTLFDAPWAVVYFAMLFIIHSWFGYLAIVGAVLILIVAFINAYATNDMLSKATEANVKSMNQAEVSTRNAEVVEAMGMMKVVVATWEKININKLEMQSIASYRNGIISNIAKFIRSILQVLVTALGAYLVVTTKQEVLQAGQMIAASIIMGRALAPFDSAIEVWKSITGAKKAYERLHNSFERDSFREQAMQLPEPVGKLSVENVLFAPPISSPKQQPRYTVKGITFALEPGDILAMIGPSAAGKTSLAKLIIGIWKPVSGVVRLDGANIFTWNRDDFGQHAGYLPQGIELFSGTVKENIARMDPDADPVKIVEAAKMTGAHELILRLPNGYETDIGIGGSALSAGQRQRVGLARAFYGNPKLVVLDEPNANLDDAGEAALAQALMNARNKKITTIVISHRPAVLGCVDKILIVQDGLVAAFGGRDEIMAKFAAGKQPTPAQAS